MGGRGVEGKEREGEREGEEVERQVWGENEGESGKCGGG